VPDLFRKGRDVVAVGKVRNGVLAATSLSTKCPSKYQPKNT
jgi:cytochrome c-type biogenesis protein CcmE